LNPADEALRDALILGFVFLAQFVDDEEARRVAAGHAQLDALALQDAWIRNPCKPWMRCGWSSESNWKWSKRSFKAATARVYRFPEPH